MHPSHHLDTTSIWPSPTSTTGMRTGMGSLRSGSRRLGSTSGSGSCGVLMRRALRPPNRVRKLA
eukprot:scaffold1954_cov268-Pinguiococcus_pyrenoidosus.AAC.164